VGVGVVKENSTFLFDYLLFGKILVERDDVGCVEIVLGYGRIGLIRASPLGGLL
jgi:hypothetical protein